MSDTLDTPPASLRCDTTFRVLNTLAPGALGSFEEFVREWGAVGPRGVRYVRDPGSLGRYLLAGAPTPVFDSGDDSYTPTPDITRTALLALARIAKAAGVGTDNEVNGADLVEEVHRVFDEDKTLAFAVTTATWVEGSR